MPLVSVFYTYYENQLEPNLFTKYVSLLSPALRARNSRFIRWQDQHLHLFGKLLLIEALKAYGIKGDVWKYMEYRSYQRPCLTLPGYDFNISHSGNFVLCAIGKNVRLGVDIEQNRAVNFKNFRSVMSSEQWNEINNADDPLKKFYKYWTIKESITKADGRGLSIAFDTLEVQNNPVEYENRCWFWQELAFGSGYSAALATDQPSEFKIHSVDFN